MAENLNLKTIDTVDTRPFKKLVMTIGELPTSFVESMTYYELLAWFVNYLETVIIPTVNNNAEAVKELQDLFVELRKFVDDYFDNLDVQEEINNKLDEMVEQGTLQEIIAEYLNSKAVFGFDSVADMKNATNFVNGSYAETLGYFSKNDGGNATYKIRKMTNDDVIDEKFIIEITGDPTNELVAELVHDEEINVLQMGVTENNLASIINKLLENNYYVYIPKGNYTLKETVLFKNDYSKLISDGRIACNASPTFRIESHYNIIKINNRCFTNQSDITFMELDGNENNVANNNDIYVNAIFNFDIGFKFIPSNGRGCAYNNINFNIIADPKTYGILLTTGNGVNYVNENYFQGGRIRGTTSTLAGIKTIKGVNQIDHFNGNVFEHICIDGCYDIGIDLEFASYNQFENFRLSENSSTNPNWLYIKTSADSVYNNFSNKSGVLITKIEDLNTSYYEKKNYYRMFLSNSSGYRLCSNFSTLCGRIIIDREDNELGIGRSTLSYPYNTTTYQNEPEFYINDGTVVTIGHDADTSALEYVLPEIFNQAGVSKFYLYVSYMGSENTFTIKQSTGATVITKENLGEERIYQKLYKIEFIGNGYGTAWKATPLT